ncbi:MAG TPA: CARDB domain-containing protein [Candidatus Binatia bacterium]|nr:CARDB domain-containing protein [Candidatus Binatia bacterium]
MGRMVVVGLLLVVAVLEPRTARAVPGGLDTTFGTRGTVTTDFGGDDAALALVRQADGKLVAAGRSDAAGSADFALSRYEADGQLDLAFGTGGRVLTDFGGNRCVGGPRQARPCGAHADCLGGTCISSDDIGWAAALQPDGKVVVAGERRACVGGDNDRERCAIDADCTNGGVCLSDFAVARYDADGNLDLTFGSAGRVVTDFGGRDEAFALALQPDGKIVVAGVSNQGGTMDFALARYGSDGDLDATFGSGGQVITDFGGEDEVFALVVQPDGNIVAAGVSTAAGSLDFALARYDATGMLDAAFGTAGEVVTDFGPVFVGSDPTNCALPVAGFHGADIAFALALQSDGKLVAGGVSTGDFALARYDTDGSLDTSFGTCGRVVTDFAGDDAAASALVIQPDGKLVAAGRSSLATQTTFALVRYAPDGTLDPIFGAAGRVVTAIGSDTEAFGLVLQPGDGHLVVAGASDGDIALARYQGDFSTLALVKAGTGSGTVGSNPAGLDCGATCSAVFPYGSGVSLTPTPAPGSVFSGWSGDADCADGSVTMDDDKTCTATFDMLVALTVELAGTGTGSVTSDPAGIDCGDACVQSYPLGTAVTLTATPAPGSRFVGWSDDCADGHVTLDTATTCTANFASNLVTLHVTKVGAGSGTVTSTPSGIDCGATCSASYGQGTTVTLTAAAAPGSVFAGWSSNCPDGQVTVTSSSQCTATFGTAGADLTGSWITLHQVCRRVRGNARCRLNGRFRMQNVGATGATGSVLRFALSTDGTTPTATLKQMNMPAMAPGDTEPMRLRAPVPGGSASGMFVLAIVDATGVVPESNETNNVIAFGPLP